MCDTPRINIPHAPQHLRGLLERLPKATGGLVVSQHFHDPYPDEWFVGWGAGDFGPFESAEAALCAGIKWTYSLYQEARHESEAS